MFLIGNIHVKKYLYHFTPLTKMLHKKVLNKTSFFFLLRTNEKLIVIKIDFDLLRTVFNVKLYVKLMLKYMQENVGFSLEKILAFMIYDL